MLPVLVLILHLLPQGILAQLDLKPYFCSEVNECYSFIDVCKDSEYETRSYEQSTWIGSYILPSEGRERAVARLAEYFNKYNGADIQIERTAPILTKFRTVNGVPRAIVVYSMLPRRFYSNPPFPRDYQTFIKYFPPMLMFVKSFGGWFTNVERKSQELFEDLLRQREHFYQDRYYTARYNGCSSRNRWSVGRMVSSSRKGMADQIRPIQRASNGSVL
ncbi:heme-binding protein 2-like isoform X3 [Heptranchias perlo]|uniref:heme-binding protein 2-like isoform X3 n=1 Tax=Heptranchias perlo TaxID=212740 RepID=UPI00355A4815